MVLVSLQLLLVVLFFSSICESFNVANKRYTSKVLVMSTDPDGIQKVLPLKTQRINFFEKFQKSLQSLKLRLSSVLIAGFILGAGVPSNAYAAKKGASTASQTPNKEATLRNNNRKKRKVASIDVVVVKQLNDMNAKDDEQSLNQKLTSAGIVMVACTLLYTLLAPGDNRPSSRKKSYKKSSNSPSGGEASRPFSSRPVGIMHINVKDLIFHI